MKINNIAKSDEVRLKISISKRGEKNASWRGGKIKHSGGYIMIHNPTHPNCTNKGYVLEHRYIIENQIGRYLTKEEVVHHINSIKTDNRIKNLFLCSNQVEHSKFHKTYDCKVIGCDRPHVSKKLCRYHYNKMKRGNHFSKEEINAIF